VLWEVEYVRCRDESVTWDCELKEGCEASPQPHSTVLERDEALLPLVRAPCTAKSKSKHSRREIKVCNVGFATGPRPLRSSRHIKVDNVGSALLTHRGVRPRHSHTAPF
jgi:hypothetical protein